MDIEITLTQKQLDRLYPHEESYEEKKDALAEYVADLIDDGFGEERLKAFMVSVRVLNDWED